MTTSTYEHEPHDVYELHRLADDGGPLAVAELEPQPTHPQPRRSPRMNIDFISSEWQAFQTLLNECEGDISDPQAEAAIDAFFNELAANQSEKLDGYIHMIRTWETWRAVMKAEIEQYTAKDRTLANRIDYSKSRLKVFLTITRQTRIETARGRVVSLQTNGGKKPLVIQIDDMAKVPDEFKRVEVTLNKDAIYEHLAAGGVLPFAHLDEPGKHVRIK